MSYFCIKFTFLYQNLPFLYQNCLWQSATALNPLIFFLDSPYRTTISQAVIKLQEEGKLIKIKNTWWKKEDGCSSQDTGEAGGGDAAELGIGNVGGVFLVLGIGLSCAFLIGILEFLWSVRKLAVETKVTQTQALKSELSFALNFSISNKPVPPSEPEVEPEEEEEVIGMITFEPPATKSYLRQQSDNFSQKIKAMSVTNMNKIGKMFNKKSDKE